MKFKTTMFSFWKAWSFDFYGKYYLRINGWADYLEEEKDSMPFSSSREYRYDL